MCVCMCVCVFACVCVRSLFFSSFYYYLLLYFDINLDFCGVAFRQDRKNLETLSRTFGN